MSAPAPVTVLLPVHNAASFIEESVASLQNQTLANLDILILDDGSTDGTDAILRRLAAADPRIRLHRRENRGLIATLNEGLAMCPSALVARMDADDHALPERLAVQYAYMAAHPEVAACGTGMETYETGRLMSWAGYGEEVRARLLFGNCLHHPTIMARASILKALGGYDATMPCAEDYDLWVRMAEAGHTLAVLPQALLRYRTHPHAPRAEYRWEQSRSTLRIQRRLLARLGLAPGKRRMDRHRSCLSHCPEPDRTLRETEAWLRELLAANARTHVYDDDVFARTVAEIRHGFRRSSWRKDPAQHVGRLLRALVMDGMRALRLGEAGEKRIIGLGWRCGVFFRGRKP